jgi:hypothetical protein
MQGTLACTGCASTCGILTAASGTFSDGSGASNYANSATCQWIIAPTGATQITLTFTEFSTESCCDIVRVYECANMSCQAGVQLVGELSGYYASWQTITSASEFILVHFTTDPSTSQSGFTATWASDAPLLPSPVQASLAPTQVTTA